MRPTTIAKWRAVLDDFDASGLSAARFCQKRGIPTSTFFSRKRELLRANPKPARPAFVEARLSAPATAAAASADIVVELPGGELIHIPANACERTLAAVVRVLRGLHEVAR